MDVNSQKTKILIFNKKRIIPNIPFVFGSTKIDIVDNYQYLGVDLQFSGSFKQAAIRLYEKGLKAHFSLISKLKDYKDIPPHLQTKLFDTLIVPILTYGSEIWITDFKFDFLDNNFPFEKVHLKNCKYILGVHGKTSNYCKCELGRFPIIISILKLLFNYYTRLAKLPTNRFLCKVFKTDKQLQSKGIKSWFGWLTNKKNLLNLQEFDSYSKSSFEKVIKDIYSRKLNSNIKSLKSCEDTKLNIFSRIFVDLHPAEYTEFDLPKCKRSLLTKLRLSCHSLMIETGRYET